MNRDQLLETHQQIKELERRKIKSSFYYFLTKVWQINEGSNKFIPNWHIKYLCFIAQMVAQDIANNKPARHSQILINICPRSLKSWIFNVALPVYIWILEPSIPVITASYSLDLGLGFSRKSQQIIQSKWFIELFGDLIQIGRAEGGRDAVQETENNKRGVRYVASTEGTITGKPLMLGVIDDPTKAQEGRHQKALDDSIIFYNESVWTRRNNPKVACIITIMQRIAQKDLSGHLIETYYDDSIPQHKNDQLLYINLPLIADGSEKIPYKKTFLKLHPEEEKNIYKNDYFFSDRFDERFIKDIKKRGDIFFNTQYQQNPLPPDGLLFKRDWFKIISEREFKELTKNSTLKKTYVTDTAYTANTRNDPSGILEYVTFEENIYITNALDEYVDSAYIPDWIENYITRRGADRRSMITIEPKGSGKVVVSLLKRLKPNLNVIEYKYPSQAKVNINMKKEERADAITPMVESGKVILVEGSWNERFISQVTTFPLNAHDEYVDLLVMAVLRAHYIDTRYRKFGLRKIN